MYAWVGELREQLGKGSEVWDAAGVRRQKPGQPECGGPGMLRSLDVLLLMISCC